MNIGRVFGRLIGAGLRTALWAILGIYFLAAVAVGVLRFAIVPNVHKYREQVAKQLEKAIGRRVGLGGVSADWSGLNPRLSIDDFKLYDDQGRLALELAHISATVSWGSVLAGEPRFSSIVVAAPALRIRRDRTGHLFVAGMEIKADESRRHGFANWLLRQHELAVTGGQVQWLDELRDAPPLSLENVAFRLQNGLAARHVFALAATPPPSLASQIDLRGRLDGDLLQEMDHWNGELYARLERTDLAGWAPWVDYPFSLRTGHGGLMMWLTLEDSRVTRVTADLNLGDVRLSLSQKLPELALAELRGRIDALETSAGPKFLSLFWRTGAGYRVSGRDVSLRTMSGPSMDHVRFAVQWSSNAGTAEVSAVDVETLANVAAAIPLPTDGRQFLNAAAPRGIVRGIKASWVGEIDSPKQYSLAAQFVDLGMKPFGQLPGFNHLSGTVELHEADGRLSASGNQVDVDWPAFFPTSSKHSWDQLGMDLRWTVAGEGAQRTTDIRVTRGDLSNADVSVAVTGGWRSLRDSPGHLDLEIAVPRMDGKAVYRYVPQLDAATADWLKGGVLAGECSQGRVSVHGDLSKFPFAEPGSGTFSVSARVSNAVLRYQPDWPVIKGIGGVLSMRGRQLTFAASQGLSAGARILDTTARLNGLGTSDPVLEVTGGADGRTEDFFRLIANSPLRATVGAATGGLRPEGRGRLDLKITVPLARANDLRVNGGYQVIDNRLEFAGGEPPLTGLNGRFQFTQRNLTGNATGQFLGGPTTLTLTSRGEEGVAVAAQGTADLWLVEQAFPFPYAAHVQGRLSYHGNILASARSLDIALESNLRGVTIDLPPPLAKPRDDAVSFQLRRRVVDAEDPARRRNSLTVVADRLFNIQAQFSSASSGDKLDRLGVGLGGAAPVLPERSAIKVAASFDHIDIDRVLPVLARVQDDGTGMQALPPLSEISLAAPEMVVFGRRFSNVSVHAQPQPHPDAWSITIDSDEASGDLSWKAGGPGYIGGHFTRLTLPESAPGAPAGRSTGDLPGMDITADRFTVAHRDLGVLKLVAANQDAGWRITQFSLSQPDGTMHAEGLWQGAAGSDHTDVEFSFESSDAGKYLASMGYPGEVRGGKATLKGHLSWNGAPRDVDYPSLTGTVTLHAEKGQFLKVEPGVGRLLGVLSLQSIPRRITLDFRDVFSQGYAFDKIDATGTLKRGILSTEDFRMISPAAAVSLSGSLDLARETQDLRVRIVPVVGESVAAAAGIALLNPFVGLGTLLAQRLLKDPLGKLFAYEYDVTGSWSDPKVTRGGRRPLLQTREGDPAAGGDSAKPGSPTRPGSATPGVVPGQAPADPPPASPAAGTSSSAKSAASTAEETSP